MAPIKVDTNTIRSESLNGLNREELQTKRNSVQAHIETMRAALPEQQKYADTWGDTLRGTVQLPDGTTTEETTQQGLEHFKDALEAHEFLLERIDQHLSGLVD